MAAGLQVFDGNGRVTFDTNYRVSRMLGFFQPPMGTGVYTDNRLTTGIPFAFYVYEGIVDTFGPYNAMPHLTAPKVTFSGNTMTVTRNSFPTEGQNEVCTLYYGVR